MEPLLRRALLGEKIPRPPVWIMRQAGRYLTEYEQLKTQYGFLGLCQSAELATRVALLPVEILDVDAAILFSDILIVAPGLGLEVAFNPGPIVKNPLRDRQDIRALRSFSPQSSVPFVLESIRMLKAELARRVDKEEKAIIGFAAAPWTLAAYLLDQGPYKYFAALPILCRRDPEAAAELLGFLATALADYLVAQIESGAQVLQLFDSSAGILSLDDYRCFALPYTQQVLEKVRKRGVPSILYVHGSDHLLEAMADSGATALSIDWRTSLAVAQARVGQRVALQGNLDPSVLFCPTAEVCAKSKTMLNFTGREHSYVANLGHGILPGTPRENAQAFVKTVKEMGTSE